MKVSDTKASSGWTLRFEALNRGVLRGTLSTSEEDPNPPEIEFCVDGDVIGKAEVSAKGEGFEISAKLPAEVLSDGVTTVVFRRCSDHSVLGAYPIRAGESLNADVVTDLAVLRAEFDALKAAFLADAHDPKLRAVERDIIVAEAIEAAASAVSRG